jgi:hypothetical protein
MSALTQPTVKAPKVKQSAADRQRVYDFVTARDKTCRAHAIDQPYTPFEFLTLGHCSGKLERHHAFTGTGSKRITDARHVVLLCEWHHRTWAPSHPRRILDWLAAVEDAREAGR